MEFVGAGRARHREGLRRQLDAAAQPVIRLHDDGRVIGRRRNNGALNANERPDMVEVGPGSEGEQDGARLVVDERPQQRLAISERLDQHRQRLGFEAERVERRQIGPLRPDLVPARLHIGLDLADQPIGADLLNQLRLGQTRQLRLQESSHHRQIARTKPVALCVSVIVRVSSGVKSPRCPRGM